MSSTLKTILTFSVIIVASFFILLGAIYVQGLPASVVTPPPVATSTTVVWNPTDISTQNVTITRIKRVSDNPEQYEVESVLSASTPNTGYYMDNNGDPFLIPVLGPDELIQIGCLDAKVECRAVLFNI